MFSFPNNVFNHPIALIYHLFHIFIYIISFRFKCNLLSSHPTSTLHVSDVLGHHQLSSIFLNCCTVCQNFVSRLNKIFPDYNKLTLLKIN
jgi:hypothetical protein